MNLFNNGKLDIDELEFMTQQRNEEYRLRQIKENDKIALDRLNSNWKQHKFYSEEIRICISTFNDYNLHTNTQKVLKFLETYSLEIFTDELRNHLAPIVETVCNNKIIYNPEIKQFQFKTEECETSEPPLVIKKKWYQSLLDSLFASKGPGKKGA